MGRGVNPLHVATTERIAREFHLAYERLAPAHGYETREASRTAWEAVPEQNRSLMIATVHDLLLHGIIRPGEALVALHDED